MSSRVYADLLAKTYYHRVSAYRPLADGSEKGLCTAVECALSRSAHTSAPTPPDGAYVLPEASYRLSLFTRPELAFRLGDRVEVTDTAGRVYRGRTSDSFCYPSHCVTVVEVLEVELPAQTAVSHETCPERGEEGTA